MAVDWDPPHDGKSGRCSLRNAKPNWLTQVSPRSTGAGVAAFGKCGDSQCRSCQIISRAKPPLTAISNSLGEVGHLLQRPILRGCRDERPLRPMVLPSGRVVPFYHVTKLEALFGLIFLDVHVFIRTSSSDQANCVDLERFTQQQS